MGEEAIVSALLNFFKKAYLYIGIVILLVGVVILQFLGIFIHGEVPSNINLYIFYGMYLFNTVISYFFCAYKITALTVYQRSDVISRIQTVVSVVQGIM